MSLTSDILLRAEQTGGAIGAVEISVPAGWEGPPLHHHAFDEAFHVLDGELTFQLGDEFAVAGPGGFAFAPGGTTHALANLAGAPARYLLLCTPAGFERRFDREPASPIPETIVVGGHVGERGDRDAATRLQAAPGGINVLVRGERSDGRIGLMDNAVKPGSPGPPLHRHDFDELFYVLDGELTFQLGDELLTRRAGELAFAPRGAHHTFANRSGAGARTLIVCTPAGFERYFARRAAEQAGVEPPAWALQPTPEVVRVGPQIGDSR